MVNGKLKTWQVVWWLEKHPRHTAHAPATAPTFDASTPDFAFVSADRMGAPGVVGVARYRNDWTIVDGRGVPVEFKRKAVSRAGLIDALRRIHDEIEGTVACEPGGPLQNAIMHAGEVLRKLENG